VGACRKTGRSLRALGLARPSGRALGAAMLIGLSAWHVNRWLVSLLPIPEGQVTTLEQLVEEPPLALVVFAICLVPAICEEVLFRGTVLRALAARLVSVVALVGSAALFSAYHLSLPQLLPTF